MEFRTLHYFLTVAHERNITRAAEKLHMAQPPLTRQIKQLEAELGVTLFHRGGRQLRLTEEGRFLQQQGAEIVQLLEKTQQQLRQMGPEEHGTLSLCTTEATGATLLSRLIGAFHETSPHIRFQIFSGSGTENRDRLEKNLVDMGIFRAPVNLEPYDQIFLHREPWGILCSPRSPLARRDPEHTQLAWLGETPLMLPMRQALQEDIDQWLGQALPQRKVFCLYSSIFSILGLAQQGLGVILAPRSVQVLVDPAKLVFRTLVGPVHPSHIYLVKRRFQLMTPAAARFWAFAQQYVAQGGLAEEGGK